MTISMDKQYRTRDGRPVDLRMVDGRGNHPVVGYVGDSEILVSWTSDGVCALWCSDDLLLVEVPPKHEWWINIYRNVTVGAYATKKLADANASCGRIACIRVEFEEGEGL